MFLAPTSTKRCFQSFKFVVPAVFIFLGSFALPALSEQKDGPDWVDSEITKLCNAALDVCHAACGPVKGMNDDCGRKCQNIWAKCDASAKRQNKRKGTTGIGSSPKSKLSK